MNILVTGMNKLQCTKDFYLQQQLKVVPSHYSLIRCLEDMGHKVEQKVVQLGEDISHYDKIILFVAAHSQNVSIFIYNGLYVLSQREDCILAFDDWQITDIYKGFEKCKDGKSIFRDFTINNYCNSNKTSIEEVMKFEKDINKGIEIILRKKNKVLISAFSGGDLSLLLDYDKNLLFSYNPNPYHLNIKPEKVIENKEKKFNFASLVQSKTRTWLKKQNITKWPIEFFGNKKEKQRRLIESEMCQVYNEQWGCLMPGYKHSGSGWWRARPLQVADAESILCGDKKELMIYYKDENLSSLRAHDLEILYDDEKELRKIALAQKEALYKNHPLLKSKQQEELNKILI